MGITLILCGTTVSTGYSYPRGDISVPSALAFRPEASASTARIVAISLMSAFVSRAEVDHDRSRESLARRRGCLETCTLDGRSVDMSVHISGVSGFKTPEERELAGSEAGVGDKCTYEMKHGYVQKQQERGSERD